MNATWLKLIKNNYSCTDSFLDILFPSSSQEFFFQFIKCTLLFNPEDATEDHQHKGSCGGGEGVGWVERERGGGGRVCYPLDSVIHPFNKCDFLTAFRVTTLWRFIRIMKS